MRLRRAHQRRRRRDRLPGLFHPAGSRNQNVRSNDPPPRRPRHSRRQLELGSSLLPVRRPLHNRSSHSSPLPARRPLHNQSRRSSPLPLRERIEGEGPFTARVFSRAIQDSASAPNPRAGYAKLCLLRRGSKVRVLIQWGGPPCPPSTRAFSRATQDSASSPEARRVIKMFRVTHEQYYRLGGILGVPLDATISDATKDSQSNDPNKRILNLRMGGAERSL